MNLYKFFTFTFASLFVSIVIGTLMPMQPVKAQSSVLFGWSLSGNANTNSAINFLGTTDNQPLVIKTNGIERMRVGSDGRVKIGTTGPNVDQLEISSDAESPVWIHSISPNKATGLQIFTPDKIYRHLEIFYNARSTPLYGAAPGDAVINGANGSNLVLSTADQARVTILTDGGNVGVGTTSPQSKLQVVGNYIQFPTISGGTPPASDCNSPQHYGRIVVRTDGATNLYVCTGSGWVGK